MTAPLTVGDRRRAALERLHGPPASTRTSTAGSARRSPSSPVDTAAPRRWLRTSAKHRITPAEARARLGAARTGRATRTAQLGPPTGTYYAIAAVVGVFVMLGLVMVLSASAVTEANLGHSPYRIFGKQAMWAGLGLVSLVVAARYPYQIWRKLVIPLGVFGVIAMCLPFAPGLGANVNGASSWIRIGGFSLQPSEFLKLAVVVLAADLLARRVDDVVEARRAIVPIALLAGVGAGLCLAQGDLGSAVVLAAIVLSVAWIAGVPITHLATVTVGGAAIALLFVVSSPRRLARFTAFTNVAEEKDHLAYQIYQGYLSIASGGLTGSGIGGGKGKLGYLPYAQSDFIFAVIADELGLVGTSAVIGGFLLLVAFGIQTALAAPDRFGMLLAGGIATWFGVQAIVNLGGVVGRLPVTGLTLPFFSAGGSSLFVSMTAAGLLLSVARRVVRS
jgi:cell division protein FtsW